MRKSIIWIGSTLRDMRSLPKLVRDEIGYALHQAQVGEKSDKAKPLKGFSGACVLEIVENKLGEAYRAVYTVKFKKAIVVLHVFHKKSKRGKETPQQDIDLIKSRFKVAEEEYELWIRGETL